jgi:hypothetical protein
MYHPITTPDPEQPELLAQVKQLALDEWIADNSNAVVGEVWVGDQQEVGRYEGATAIWLVWVYPTPGHLQVYRVWLDLQAEMGKTFRGPYEANRYADLHGGIHYHYSLVGQFADGLRILENCPDKAKEPKQPGWMRHTSYTLEKLRAQLSDLTRFLSHNEESTPDWQQARQQVLEMYTNLNALEVLCRQQGKLDAYATATTMRVIPCAFPVPDEDGAGVVWMRTELSQYGLYVVIHKHRPGAHPQPGEGMAALHVDYYNNRIQIQIYDEVAGPDGDTHWGSVHNPYGKREPLVLDLPRYVNSCPIILVEDVEHWKEPNEQTES